MNLVIYYLKVVLYKYAHFNKKCLQEYMFITLPFIHIKPGYVVNFDFFLSYTSNNYIILLSVLFLLLLQIFFKYMFMLKRTFFHVLKKY